MATPGFFSSFNDVWLLGGVRTPMVDYCGALGHLSPTDLGIKAAREVLARTGVRLTITLAREMQRAGVRWGIASACIGGGQGIALLLENPAGV